jgi:hypothetical protein
MGNEVELKGINDAILMVGQALGGRGGGKI